MSLTGCAGRLPGTGPAHAHTEKRSESSEISWTYPPVDHEDRGIDYASFRFDGPHGGGQPSWLFFRFNSTVWGTYSKKYDDYEADWFRFRVGLPTGYPTATTVEFYIRPPPWPKVTTRFDQRGGRRELVVTAPEVGSDGTIEVPFVLDLTSDTLPKRLYCSFTVQASQTGVLGKTVRATNQGTLKIESDSA